MLWSTHLKRWISDTDKLLTCRGVAGPLAAWGRCQICLPSISGDVGEPL